MAVFEAKMGLQKLQRQPKLQTFFEMVLIFEFMRDEAKSATSPAWYKCALDFLFFLCNQWVCTGSPLPYIYFFILKLFLLWIKSFLNLIIMLQQPYRLWPPSLTEPVSRNVVNIFRINWKPNWSSPRLSWARPRPSLKRCTGTPPPGTTTTTTGDRSWPKLNWTLTD